MAALAVPKDNTEWRALTEADQDAQEHLAKARRRVKGYKILNGCLYNESRLYVPKTKRLEAMTTAHAEEPACYGWFRATVERLQHLWWPQMAEETRKFVESCPICQARKSERNLPRGQMNSFTTTEPLQLVALDALEVQASLSGKKFIFVAIDVFTRFVDLEASDTLLGEAFAKFLASYIGRFGVPNTILTDNASTMVNEHTKKLSS